ncbi:TOMM precursor leader peptide-binding protein [Halobacillus sp. Nhm2S1]|uniref:TOMM precursor leader peptide-binding protein n=1 Tax=Halobacillus sp. Nhm2S1 TaxID=2866716 RepID=UPI001C73A8A0|nr:TOMM precursor leader peptide-binding protein [Halobacillus sp. Nhm2S1]MBX0356719.1 TOMM precursor leader peptide-binding protein [Halobacillus sp. Nhm2S1]
MSTLITVVGGGVLLDCVVKELKTDYEMTRLSSFEKEVPDNTDLLLVLEDGWSPAASLTGERIAREYGIDWLRGFVAFGEGVIGPFVRSGAEGCSQCADVRRTMTAGDRKDLWNIQQTLMEHTQARPDEWASLNGALQMACLIKNEVQRWSEGKHPLTEKAVHLINMRTLESSSHPFLPDSQCPYCSTVIEDAASHAEIVLNPSLKISEGSYRSRSIEELSTFLTKDYLDPRTGILNHKMIDFETPFADVIVNLPLLNGNEGSAGRTNSYAASERTAILEGLERFCGMDPKGKRTLVYDSYSNLHSALNPLDVGVHSNEQYATKDFPFTPYHPDKKMNWVWGYSLQKNTPILVPERLAYYSMGCSGGFIFETSNGCAIGGSREEAIFHGMMEVLERDSFLLSWYAELPLPRLDPSSSGDQELLLMIDRMKEIAGYDLYLYNATMEHGIPCILTVIKKSKTDSGDLNLICAAGAHLDPVKAVKSAVFESAGMIEPLNKEFKENREKYVKMLHDSSLVKKMDDHGMVYGLPEAEERLGFLLNQDGPVQTFEEAFHQKQTHPDLTEDVKDLLDIFREMNLDVIVIDQTASELKRNGLSCVKVLIPGMLPMTFGHHLRRLEGLKRVLEVPEKLGYSNRPLTLDELNPYPHPFP